jgi:hypothetical protein
MSRPAPPRLRFIAVPVVIALIVIVSGYAQADARTRHLYWGAWIGSQLTGQTPPWHMGPVHRFGKLAGKGLSLVEFGSPFAECDKGGCTPTKFPTTPLRDIRVYGAIPVFSWNSASTPTRRHEPNYRLGQVINGRFDHYIRGFAKKAKAWGHPFFLRFDWEMNGTWFPWAEGVNRNSGGQFVAAWRHVHDIFTAVGANNVSWVWCPYADPRHELAGLRGLYPGPRYVDWTCMDGYNWGRGRVNRQPWMSFHRIFSSTYARLTRLAPRKPVMVGEFASSTYGGSKSTWIRRAFRSLPRRFPRVRAVIWYDQIDRGVDWPIETSRGATRAFRAAIGHESFVGNGFDHLAGAPIRPPSR